MRYCILLVVAPVEISRYLEELREERLVNGGYPVECLNIIAKLRDNSLKIKWYHVECKNITAKLRDNNQKISRYHVDAHIGQSFGISSSVPWMRPVRRGRAMHYYVFLSK